MSTASATRTKPKKNILAGAKAWFLAAVVVAVLVAIGIFVILAQLTATTTYYVLNQDVPARSQITADMLTPVKTSEGGQPRNALDIGYVQTQYTAAKYALSTGDIITESNVGALDPINKGIPSNYTVASFTAPAQNAVAGKLVRGDYIDLIATNGESQLSKYVLRHVLVLDVAADLGQAQDDAATPNTGGVDAEGNEVSAAEGNQTRQGIPALYTVALPTIDAAKLANITATDSSILVVLTPKDFEAESDISIGGESGSVFAPGSVGDSGIGTDPTFGDGASKAVPNQSSENQDNPENQNLEEENTTDGENSDNPDENQQDDQQNPDEGQQDDQQNSDSPDESGN